MDDEKTRLWWKNQMENNYFTSFGYGFSYSNMAKFNLKGKKILELGFGFGRELSQFCKLSQRVCGLDIAPAAPALAKKKLEEQGIDTSNLSVNSYDGTDIKAVLGDQKFDFIYNCFVLQHMSKANAHKLIVNSLNQLEKDGTIFFEFFGYPDFMAGPGKDAYSGDPENGGMYNNAFTEQEIMDFLKDIPCTVDVEKWPLGDAAHPHFDNYWVTIRHK